MDAIKFYTHALTPSESSVAVSCTRARTRPVATYSVGMELSSEAACILPPQILCKRADAMVRFARHTRGRSASQLDEDVVTGPDAETLAMMALRDVRKILDLDSTWYGNSSGRALYLPKVWLTDR